MASAGKLDGSDNDVGTVSSSEVLVLLCRGVGDGDGDGKFVECPYYDPDEYCTT